MPLQATSGAASYDAFGGGVAVVPTYIEDVFQTWLYSGSASTQTITNNIDLSGKGGLVWIKIRNDTLNNILFDTTRGDFELISNSTAAQADNNRDFVPLSTGFSLKGGENVTNNTPNIYTSWTFREQAKFFDVVTWTGTGANRTITHALGAVPGCIIVKRTDTTADWQVYHRSNANTEYLVLNSTAAKATGATRWNSTTPTSTVFSLGTDATVNASGGTYVAYIFAHDAGGFGLTGTDNVISCGSFTTDGSGNTTVSLGYEPQWVMYKGSSTTGNWTIVDSMLGFPVNADGSPPTYQLFANSSSAENGSGGVGPTATGFAVKNGYLTPSSTYIYIAIRRGPMKVPTLGTSVFQPIQYASDNTDNRLITTGIVTDAVFSRYKDAITSRGTTVGARLIGNSFLGTASTAAENTGANAFDPPTVGYGNGFSTMIGFGVGTNATALLNYGTIYNAIAYGFRRSPSVFDIVCYTGTGSSNTISHNLTVTPELIISKQRSGVNNWLVSSPSLGKAGYLNTVDAFSASYVVYGSVTSASFTALFSGSIANGSGQTYVAYLFATCAGVSKVGTYTGTAAAQTINCGFTSGARFVLIKRVDAQPDTTSGPWYVWDSARGITSGNDPYLLLNSTAAEVTSLNYVDTDATGFKLTTDSGPQKALNDSGGTYIFLAIA